MSQIVIGPSKNELKFTNSTVVKIVVCITVYVYTKIEAYRARGIGSEDRIFSSIHANPHNRIA